MPSSEDNSLLFSTQRALPQGTLDRLAAKKICIVGCGAVGSIFAELLIRTGALNLTLIDGDKIEQKNLNRLPFTQRDVGRKKADALKGRLHDINSSANIVAINCMLRNTGDEDKKGKKAREAVLSSRLVLVFPDNNADRFFCEQLCKKDDNIDLLSVGVFIGENSFSYECRWNPKISKKNIENKGYGKDNGSFASIVWEATSVGFNMLLSQLSNHCSDFKYCYRQYKNFGQPSQCFKPPAAKNFFL